MIRSQSSREQKEAVQRPRRTPVSGNRDILTATFVPKDKKARFVNDVEDRLLRFMQAGYEFVTDQGVLIGEKTVDASKGVGNVVYRLVGSDKFGKPMYAYLMAIDRALWEQDQADKQADIDAVEQAMHDASRKENHYGELRVSVEDSNN